MIETPETDALRDEIEPAIANKDWNLALGKTLSLCESLETRLRQSEADLVKARDTALEDAANVCDEYARLDNPNAVTISTLSAKAIRALAAKEKWK